MKLEGAAASSASSVSSCLQLFGVYKLGGGTLYVFSCSGHLGESFFVLVCFPIFLGGHLLPGQDMRSGLDRRVILF